MTKKLRSFPIYIAPSIIGWKDEEHNIHVHDEINSIDLDPTNVDDKIIIYERQVKGWFINKAFNMARARKLEPFSTRGKSIALINRIECQSKSNSNGFVVLMICLSYLEGIEQYIQGTSSNNRSRQFFISSIKRMYPNEFEEDQLRELYSEARCGLFHNGMVRGRIIISYDYAKSIEFNATDIMINPLKLTIDIRRDFDNYLQNIRLEGELRNNFNRMFSNLW